MSQTNAEAAADAASDWPLYEHTGGLEITCERANLYGWVTLTLKRGGVDVTVVLSAEQLDAIATLAVAAGTQREREHKGAAQR